MIGEVGYRVVPLLKTRIDVSNLRGHFYSYLSSKDKKTLDFSPLFLLTTDDFKC